MLLHRITTTKELLDFAHLVINKIECNDPKGYLSQDPTTVLIDQFFGQFSSGYYYGSITKGELDYFCILLPYVNNKTEWLWLFYVSPKRHQDTKDLISQIRNEAKNRGINTVYFATSRLQPSYRRWVEKQGARQFSITYKLEV